MKTKFTLFILLVCTIVGYSQKEFHVTIDGNASGDGSIEKPWDLQTALGQSPSIVTPGSNVWLHGGIYNGRFISTVSSTESDKPIMVSALNGETVILNGNVTSNRKAVLEVKGKNVIYKDFEVGFLGNFNRDENKNGLIKVDGVNHVSGTNCKFVNIKIYDNPGSGFGSWKATGGSEILDCIIYNNGFISKAGRGSGVGIYVQNNSSNTRLIDNNTIFNNYYKGIEVWSANKNAESSYVQNITLRNNAVFNNGSPAGSFKDNLIIGTDDRNGKNIAKNILIENNIFYHNTDVKSGEVGGDAASLTIGFNSAAPVENVILTDNLIIGRNNAFRVLHAKSLTLKDNIAYCGYVHLDASVLTNIKDWKLEDNTYYTKKGKSFRIIKNKDYSMEEWKKTFQIDEASQWFLNKQFENKIGPSITKFQYNKNKFKVSIFNSEGTDGTIDFSNLKLKNGTTFTIIDVENPGDILVEGLLNVESKISFPMNTSKLQFPSGNDMAKKTLSNFGVYIIEFNADQTTLVEEKSFLGKLFDWLGF